MMTIRKLTAWLICVACLLGGVALAAPEGRISADISGAKSKGLEKLDGVLFELYRIGEPDASSESGWRCASGFESVTALTKRGSDKDGQWSVAEIDAINEQAQAAAKAVSPVTAQTNESGVAAFTGLEDGIYYIIKPEDAAPVALKTQPCLVAIPSPSAEGAGGFTRDVDADIKLEYTPPESVSVPVRKVWMDSNNFDGVRPDSVTARLLQNGQPVAGCEAKVLSAENDWAATWANLPSEDEHGVAYVYTVTEDVPSGYTLTAPASTENEFVLENVHNVEKGSLRIRKTVDVASIGSMDEATRTKLGNYLAGLTFTFHVTGPSDADYAASGMTKVTEGDHHNYVDCDISVTVDANTLTGEYLFSGTLMPGHYTVTEATGKLPAGMKLTESPQNPIEVKAGETAVAEAAFTNTQALGSLSIVKRVQVSGAGATSTALDGSYVFDVYGPDSFRASDRVATQTITVKNGVSSPAQVNNLLPGVYRVIERTTNLPQNTIVTYPDGNSHEVVAGNAENPTVFTVVNSRPNPSTPTVTPGAPTPTQIPPVIPTPTRIPSVIPTPTTRPGNNPNPPSNPTPTPAPTPTPSPTPVPVISVSGEKVWNDENNIHGVRPNSITVRLVANGETIAWQTVIGPSWQYVFENLPQVDAGGQNILYDVVEDPVSGYTSAVSGSTIINTLIPQEPKSYTSISGGKTWNDEGNAAGIRPNYITIILLRNGVELERRTVTAASNWQYTFADLPMDDGYGNAYYYSIREEGVPGYFLRQTGNNLVNTLLPNIVPPEPGKQPPPGETPPKIPNTPLIEYGDLSEEELEDLLDIFDYDTALWGGLLKTGQETPTYPYVFAGIGAAALIALVVIMAVDRKKRQQA